MIYELQELGDGTKTQKQNMYESNYGVCKSESWKRPMRASNSTLVRFDMSGSCQFALIFSFPIPQYFLEIHILNMKGSLKANFWQDGLLK